MIALPANEQEDCSIYARHCLQTERQWWPMEGRGSVIPDGNSKFLGAVFLWRFGDDQAVVVLLYFFALTMLLFTPAVWDPQVALGLPIGGFHYFAVVGTLPAFHLA